MKKINKFGDDICYFEDTDTRDYFVKACEEGKYCEEEKGNSNFRTCQDIPKAISLKKFGEDCDTDFECEYNLQCFGECTLDCTGNTKPVKVDRYYKCIAEKNVAPEGVCYYADSKWVVPSGYTIGDMEHTYKFGNIGKNQICGHITKFNSTLYTHTIQEVKPASIGTLDDGEYVLDQKLCKSGYALYFYADQKKLTDPRPSSMRSTSNPDYMYLMCVTPTNINFNPFYSSTCIISYNIGGQNEKIYNADQLLDKQTAIPSTYQNTIVNPNNAPYNIIGSIQINNICEPYLMIKAQRFQEYLGNLTDTEREKCGDLENNIENRINCNNKDILKAWYYYTTPKDYYIYSDKEDLEGVVDYFIQKNYYSYPAYGNLMKINLLLIISLLFLL